MNAKRVHEEHTDEEIAGFVQAGDIEKFAVLLERYEEKLLRYGRKFLTGNEDIEDIVQTVFMKAFQNIRGFRTEDRFSPWIYRIAHNEFVNGLKRKSYLPLSFFDLDTLVPHPVYEDPAINEREQKEMQELLAKGLEQLSPKYREVLVLHYLQNLGYKEIAEILQVPTGTVSVRMRRAKTALREAYNKLNLSHGA